MGRIDFIFEDVRKIVDQLGKDFKGDQYYFLNKNCNYFIVFFIQVKYIVLFNIL